MFTVEIRNSYYFDLYQGIESQFESVYHVHKGHWEQSPFGWIVFQVSLHPVFILSFRVYNDNDVIFFKC